MVIIPDEKGRKKAAKNNKSKKGQAVKPPKRSEMDLRAMMNELWKTVLFPATERIEALIRSKASPEQIAAEIEMALDIANTKYQLASDSIIDRWRMSVNQETRLAMQRSLRKGLGIDTLAIFDDPRISEALQVGSMEMSQLIVSIPGEYLGKVARAVTDNYLGRSLPEGRSLLEQIKHIGGVTENRAKLIARDQTSKLTGIINQTRQQGIGIDEYIWRTVKDERVVGRPGGIYPDGNKVHGDHYHREGKKFRWDTPPPDGHPGHPIQCRCWAEPIINPAKIAEMAKQNLMQP